MVLILEWWLSMVTAYDDLQSMVQKGWTHGKEEVVTAEDTSGGVGGKII